MAVLAAPEIAWSSPSLEPQSMASIAEWEYFALPSIVVFGPAPGASVLAAPAFNQLINDAATGTPF